LEKSIPKQEDIPKFTINTDILKYVDVAIFAGAFRKTIDPANKSMYIDNINKLKDNLNKYIDTVFTLSGNTFDQLVQDNTKTTLDYSYLNFNIHLYLTSTKAPTRLLQTTAWDNSIINLDKCEALVRKLNNIDADTPIIVRKMEYLRSTFEDSDNDHKPKSPYIISVTLWEYKARYQILTNACKQDTDTQITYNIAFPTDVQAKAITTPYYNENIPEPFDMNDNYYQSRCVNSYSNSPSAFDTTINFRRQYYFQSQANCPNNCKYKGRSITNNFNRYINCECEGGVPEVSYQFDLTTLDPVRTVNLDVVRCAFLAFTRVIINYLF
jgi:hypothetical protein